MLQYLRLADDVALVASDSELGKAPNLADSSAPVEGSAATASHEQHPPKAEFEDSLLAQTSADTAQQRRSSKRAAAVALDLAESADHCAWRCHSSRTLSSADMRPVCLPGVFLPGDAQCSSV